MTSGIYHICNKITGDVYIGSSDSLSRRFKAHINLLRRDKHHSLHLQNAWNKYKEENFTFEVLEYVPVSDLLVKEQRYLDEQLPSYNICRTAGRCNGRIMKEESKLKSSTSHLSKRELIKKKVKKNILSIEACLKISESKKNIRRAVKQFTLDNVFVQEWPSLYKLTQEKGYSSSDIRKCLSKRKICAHGYKWEYV